MNETTTKFPAPSIEERATILSEAHKKLPVGKYFHQPPWAGEIELVCIHSDRHLDFTEIGEFKDASSVAFLMSNYEHLPAILGHLQTLESERRWISVDETPSLLPEKHSDDECYWQESKLLEMVYDPKSHEDSPQFGYFATYCDNNQPAWFNREKEEIEKPAFYRVFIGPEVPAS